VGDDDVGVFCEGIARGGAEEADGEHSGAVGGFDAGGGVFDYGAVLWGNSKFLGGEEENLGVGFAVFYFTSVDGLGDEGAVF
jgi:hypothetical protein